MHCDLWPMLSRQVKVDGQNLAPVTLTQHYYVDVPRNMPWRWQKKERKHGGLKWDHCPILIPQEKKHNLANPLISQYALLSLDYPTIIIYVYIIYQNSLMSIIVVWPCSGTQSSERAAASRKPTVGVKLWMCPCCACNSIAGEINYIYSNGYITLYNWANHQYISKKMGI
jgi:hypothetical protein